MRLLLTIPGMVKAVLAGFLVGVVLGVQMAGGFDADPTSCRDAGSCVVRTHTDRNGPADLSAGTDEPN